MLFLLGCREDPIEIELFGTINGQVFNDNTLLPVNGAEVSTNPASSKVNTDSLGAFSLENVPVGTYSLKVEKEGFITEFESVTVIEDKIVIINVNLAEDNGENQSPIPPQLLTPADGSLDVLTDVELTWSKGEAYQEDDLTYDVILINENAEEIVLVSDTRDTSFLLENLNYNTTYFWYVIAKDGVNLDANSPLFSFRTTKISDHLFLYVRKVDGLYQIFSSDPDGLNESRLTNNLTNNWAPRFSPDGSLIAYISIEDNENHIFVMDTDGNNVRKITSGVSMNSYYKMEMDFCWSPDGTKILYMSHQKIYAQDINTSGGPANSLITSPDGKIFTSVDWKGNHVLVRTSNFEGFQNTFYLYDAQTLSIIDTIAYYEKGRVTGPYFSRDGGKIVFSHDVAQFPATFDDGKQRQADIFMIAQLTAPYHANSLSSEAKPVGTNDLNPRFSPSGAFVVFTNENIDGLDTPAIYRLNIAEPGERTLIFTDAMMPDWRNP